MRGIDGIERELKIFQAEELNHRRMSESCMLISLSNDC